MPLEPIRVSCPDCGASMEVNPATGEVLSHEKGGGAAPADLGDLVRRTEKRTASAADKFEDALRAEKQHRDTLEDKFKKAQDKAKEDPDAKPESPFDDRWS